MAIERITKTFGPSAGTMSANGASETIRMATTRGMPFARNRAAQIIIGTITNGVVQTIGTTAIAGISQQQELHEL